MSTTTKILAGLCLVGFVAACSEPEPEMVTVAPTIDKMGNATCPAGFTLGIMSESGTQACVQKSMDDMSMDADA